MSAADVHQHDAHGGSSAHGHGDPVDLTQDQTSLGERAWPVYNIAKIAGFVGIIGGVLLGYFLDPGFRRFYFAYLISFAFFLSIALGSLAFVLLQHLTRAGWSVSVRRSAECLAATMPILLALSAPILLSVLLQRGDLYRWAQPKSRVVDTLHGGGGHSGEAAAEAQGAAGANQGPQGRPAPANPHPGEQAPHAVAPGDRPAVAPHPNVHGDPAHTDKQGGGGPKHDDQHGGGGSGGAHGHAAHPSANGVPPLDELTLKKRAMLNPLFFTVRIVGYFAVWSAIALWYWRRSAEQDTTGDVALSERMQQFSPPAILILALTITFAAFDLLMSLDPHWFSTMFGVYYLTGSLKAMFAALILCLGMLQGLGYLKRSVTTEHYHDLGKWLFGFVFFWGYIAFSQYMLLWYASIPEETGWLARRGASSAHEHIGGWTTVSIVLLLGQFVIPFIGLMSRHAKRRRPVLMFFAAWVLVFHWLDLYWVVMPELDGRVHFGIVELLCFVGVGGIFLATYLRLLAKNALRPLRDPRLGESVMFQNL